MKIRIVYLLIAFAALIVSCAPKKQDDAPDVKYYRHLQFTETPYDRLQGIYPLTSDEAGDINHYRFDYNEKGQLVEVSYRRGNELLSYSSMGAAKIQIEYSPGKEIYTYYDKNENPKKNGGAWKAVYSTDENGVRTGLSYEDSTGAKIENRNNIAYYTWIVLPDGMVQEKRYNKEDVETVMNPFCPFYELRFSYDDNGYPTRMANYMGDTLYDCTEENCGDIGVSYFLFENNDKGGLTNFSVHNTAGQLSNLYSGWAKFENKLDDNGYVLERISYDQDDELLRGKAVPVNAYVYDDHGAVIERKFLDGNRNPVENGQGTAVIRYSYDEVGNPVDTAYFSASGVENS